MNKISYGLILISIVATILIFALLYFYLNASRNGTNRTDLDFFESIYFSVVTFTTLGYGDIFPIGFGKFLVIIEALVGVFLASIFIGKISSERQSTKLTLIYSSINHKRILELIEDINEKEADFKRLYLLHNNLEMLNLSKETYDFVSTIRKYLTLHSLEGELASYGNSSTLRRLYIALSKLQKTLSIINKTYGINERIITINKRTITTIGEIGRNMKQFHTNETQIISNLNELELEMERNKQALTPNEIIYRTEINEELLNVIRNYNTTYTDLTANYQQIAQELGMTNKLCQRCIEKINNYA